MVENTNIKLVLFETKDSPWKIAHEANPSVVYETEISKKQMREWAT